MFDNLQYIINKWGRFEDKLRCYSGYRRTSLLKWKKQLMLPWKTATKILNQLVIFNQRDVRDLVDKLVVDNQIVFSKTDCYICSFGDPGKSGGVVLYDFRHRCPQYSPKIIETWKVPGLPDDSTIIFIDDVIGTGRQSVEYITEVLNSVLNPSHKAYLMSVCATPQGVSRVKLNTDFQVIYGLELNEEKFQFLSTQSVTFTDDEKQLLKAVNLQLEGKTKSTNKFDLGLLIAFYYSVPNNTMPLIWKDGFKYSTKEGTTRSWYALLPRAY